MDHYTTQGGTQGGYIPTREVPREAIYPNIHTQGGYNGLSSSINPTQGGYNGPFSLLIPTQGGYNGPFSPNIPTQGGYNGPFSTIHPPREARMGHSP